MIDIGDGNFGGMICVVHVVLPGSYGQFWQLDLIVHSCKSVKNTTERMCRWPTQRRIGRKGCCILQNSRHSEVHRFGLFAVPVHLHYGMEESMENVLWFFLEQSLYLFRYMPQRRERFVEVVPDEQIANHLDRSRKVLYCLCNENVPNRLANGPFLSQHLGQ